MRSGFDLGDDMELVWLRNGASSEELEDELYGRADDYDVILALPYLFGTTYFAFETCPEKFMLIPCLHDEPAAHTRFTRRMLSETKAILFSTDAEVRLARSLAPSLAPSAIVAVGVESGAETAKHQRDNTKPPSILYVGRREVHKNYPLMIEYFLRYKERRGGELRLVLSTTGEPLSQHDDIVEVTPDWQTLDVYRDATVFCHPGVNESLSIVLLQAWIAECPAMVHADCEVTREHCERSNGGLWFGSYLEFEAVLDRLLESEDLRTRLGHNGRAYVQREYSWDVVLGRFDAAIERFLGTERVVTPVAHQAP